MRNSCFMVKSYGRTAVKNVPPGGIRNLSKEQKIFQQVVDAIVSGKLEPGLVITDTSLAEQFNTSRTPMRTVLSKLIGYGLVVLDPPRLRIVPMSKDYLRQILEVGELFTVAGLTLVAKQRDREDFIEYACKNETYIGIKSSLQLQHTELLEFARKAFHEFRSLVISKIHNDILIDLLNMIDYHLNRILLIVSWSDEEVLNFVELQINLARNIAEGNIEKVSELQLFCIKNLRKKLFSLYANNTDGANFRLSFPTTLYFQLREDILLNPDYSGAILNPVDLAERYGVSRTPVREALKTAEMYGLVVQQPGIGTKVRDREFLLFVNLMQLRFLVDNANAKSLLVKYPNGLSRFDSFADEFDELSRQMNWEDPEYMKAFRGLYFRFYEYLGSQLDNRFLELISGKLATLMLFVSSGVDWNLGLLCHDLTLLRAEECRKLAHGDIPESVTPLLEKSNQIISEGVIEWFLVASSMI